MTVENARRVGEIGQNLSDMRDAMAENAQLATIVQKEFLASVLEDGTKTRDQIETVRREMHERFDVRHPSTVPGITT
jgi:hypothetical protein